jgi:hypothetical protein
MPRRKVMSLGELRRSEPHWDAQPSKVDFDSIDWGVQPIERIFFEMGFTRGSRWERPQRELVRRGKADDAVVDRVMRALEEKKDKELDGDSSILNAMAALARMGTSKSLVGLVDFANSGDEWGSHALGELAARGDFSKVSRETRVELARKLTESGHHYNACDALSKLGVVTPEVTAYVKRLLSGEVRLKEHHVDMAKKAARALGIAT